MKKVWLHLISWNKDCVTAAAEAGVDAILTAGELCGKVKELGRIDVVAPEGGDIKIPDDVEFVTIKDKATEDRAAEILKTKTAAVRTTDWDIIPIENLIPVGGEKLFLFVKNREEAELAAGIMEKGVGGIIIESEDPAEITEIVKFIKSIGAEKVDLSELKITDIKNIGIGDRVCVDTCSNLESGEGLLTGNSSSCLFMVYAENIENPYVAPRPFRVNAGAVHAYVRVPDDKTRYLGELKTGDPVLVTNYKGETYTSYVGRSKIEKRPLLVIKAVDSSGDEHSVILQNAETIRLTAVDGTPVSVASLSPGDTVLARVESGGRHFGLAVDESIKEQ